MAIKVETASKDITKMKDIMAEKFVIESDFDDMDISELEDLEFNLDERD